ncbi:hypothetical protein [Sutterella wadsworthensis]|uniref:hypothetical protein n=3 Tax=Sutterella wadsworthensis TaxID=40545 RepID=UPI003520B96B
MSLPVIAYVLQPDQVIFTPTTENGPLPGIYAASDFIAKWRDWDAGTAGRPARAWHTLFDAVLKAGDRFDFFLLDEALKAYGEELFSDPQERLEWCIRTAIGLERWDEAKRLINELEGYALPPSGSAHRLPEDFSSPVHRLRAEWAYARTAAGMEDDILVPTLVDELFVLGETQKAEHLIARAWPAVFSALLSFLQPEENAGNGSDAQETAQWRRTILRVGQNCTLMKQCSSALSFHQRLWRAAAFLYFSQDERDVETGLNELMSLTSLLRPAEEVLEVLALMTVVFAGENFEVPADCLAWLSCAMDRRRAAVLPARKKAEADIRPHPAEVLTESAEACRAEADRFWLLRSLFMEGNVLDLKKRLAYARFIDRTFIEELLLRVLDVRCAAKASHRDRDALAESRQYRLKGHLAVPSNAETAAALSLVVNVIEAEVLARLSGDLLWQNAGGKAVNGAAAAQKRSEGTAAMKEALDRAARQLGIEFVRYIFGDADGPIVSLGRGAMLALYFAPRSPMNDERFILQESVGPLSPGEYRAEKLLELWRREASPFKMPEDFLRLVVEAGRRTKPKSADVRLFKPMLIKWPDYFGDDLHQLLWHVRMAVAEQRWADAEAGLFTAAECLLDRAQDAARDETIESLWLEAASLAAWTAAGRVVLVPGIKWMKPYADNEAELIVERLRLGIPDAVKLADLFAELSDAAPA